MLMDPKPKRKSAAKTKHKAKSGRRPDKAARKK
jgi:hypothetical protein